MNMDRDVWILLVSRVAGFIRVLLIILACWVVYWVWSQWVAQKAMIERGQEVSLLVTGAPVISRGGGRGEFVG